MLQVVTSLILAPVVQEFHARGPFLKLGQNVGLLVGKLLLRIVALFLRYLQVPYSGASARMSGEEGLPVQIACGSRTNKFPRPSFNITLLIIGVFALAAGGAPSFESLSSFVALWSIGVGGNLPVDSAIFLGPSQELHVCGRV